MSSSSSSLPAFTIIVATTPSLGIGHNNTFPWPPLKPDLRFFARVTKRPSPSLTSPSPPNSSNGPNGPTNAVIMGRKTYTSIPASFRPLRDRTNVVITSQSRAALDLPPEVRTAASLPDALRQLQEGKEEQKEEKEWTLSRVFVIGGAQVFEQALGMRECERVLWTRVGRGGGQREWVCDTFFPKGVVPGDGIGGKEEEEREGRREWKRAKQEDMERWVGEEARATRVMVNVEDGEGRQEESEVEVELEWSMWVREGGG